jgi:hypothetical protein
MNNNIKNNNIQKLKTGITIAESYKNIIMFNNIYRNNIDSFFINSFNNIWDSNYWGKTNTNFKIIFGMLIIPYTIVGTPWINFDLHPSLEIYDINS